MRQNTAFALLLTAVCTSLADCCALCCWQAEVSPVSTSTDPESVYDQLTTEFGDMFNERNVSLDQVCLDSSLLFGQHGSLLLPCRQVIKLARQFVAQAPAGESDSQGDGASSGAGAGAGAGAGSDAAAPAQSSPRSQRESPRSQRDSPRSGSRLAPLSGSSEALPPLGGLSRAGSGGALGALPSLSSRGSRGGLSSPPASSPRQAGPSHSLTGNSSPQHQQQQQQQQQPSQSGFAVDNFDDDDDLGSISEDEVVFSDNDLDDDDDFYDDQF